MSNVLRLALVDPSDSTREALKSMLLGMDMVWLEAECSRYEFFADVVGQTQPDVGVVSLDADCDKALNLIAEVQQSAPKCSVLVVSRSSDGELILRAMRAGAKEFLTQPVQLEDMLASLDRIASSARYMSRFASSKVRRSAAACVNRASCSTGVVAIRAARSSAIPS